MRSVTLVAALAVALAACTGSGDAGPSSPPAAAFELRAWTTQALPPDASFAGGPMLAITDGQAITPGAVPAIYPGPLVTPLIARPITEAGMARIVAEMEAAGLLGERTDFTERMPPGAPLAHILVSLDGASREVTGDPSRVIQCIAPPCVPPPGTPEAFATIWNALFDLGGWLGSAVGTEQPYVARRAAILVTEPTIDPAFAGQVVAWPLDGTFAETGIAFPGVGGARCVIVEGETLEAIRPSLEAANQLTRFRDRTGVERGLIVRWLVPNEPDPCSV
ncbi:MAG TPA: hypothetical protein VFK54_03810 [Candidatus Limnocylindrales bacterium]|nr:hypothetical protein [Candidatus Limnocylindrales bacterium]